MKMEPRLNACGFYGNWRGFDTESMARFKSSEDKGICESQGVDQVRGQKEREGGGRSRVSTDRGGRNATSTEAHRQKGGKRPRHSDHLKNN